MFDRQLRASLPKLFSKFLWGDTCSRLTSRTALLTCDGGNGNIVYTQKIAFTDFPLDEINLYFTDSTILLPSEY